MKYCDIFDNCAQCPVPFCPQDEDDEMLDLDEAEEDENDGW